MDDVHVEGRVLIDDGRAAGGEGVAGVMAAVDDLLAGLWS
jgi:hypothetical protein